MQNKYVGDIGDFGKYVLLKALCLPANGDRDRELSLGVAWYLVPDDDRKGDGSLTEYASLEICDPVLFRQLEEIVAKGQEQRRGVKTVRVKGILPPGTAFYEQRLTFDNMPAIGTTARQARLARRHQWLNEVLEKTESCDLVFVDPDIGLEVRSVQSHHGRGPQYVFFCELRQFRRGQNTPSLIIYQHMTRQGKVDDQIQRRLLQIVEKLEEWATPFALQFRTSRFFFVVPAKAHEDTLLERASRFTKEPWDEHFRLVRLQAP